MFGDQLVPTRIGSAISRALAGANIGSKVPVPWFASVG
jgi:hypothetical protein